MQHAPTDLLNLLAGFGQPRILVVGDLILDEYIYGDAERLSPEAPVPVVRQRSRQARAGGAGNVAMFLAALGAAPILAGVRGHDVSGESLVKLLRDGGADVSGVLSASDRPTSTKTRLIGLAQHRHQQQMLRLDNECIDPIDAALSRRLFDFLQREIPTCAVVCLEDYNKGLLTPELCAAIILMARQAGKPVLVDPAFIADYRRYAGATAITPNRTEAELATGIKTEDIEQEAPALAKNLLADLDLKACILTLDRHGMYLLEHHAPGHLHTTRPRNVYDVTGAGDMVLAMLALAVAHGVSFSAAVDLGNIAGGLEVERFGCVPISRMELRDELNRMNGAAGVKIRTLADLLPELAAHRQAGRRIAFTHGVFDILHAGHAQYLHFARSQADILVVGVNSDDSVRRLKGQGRPVNSLADRMAVLAALEAVNYVTPFTEDTPLELVRACQPDVLVKDADYTDKLVVGRDIVEARGGRVVLAPLLAGRSTSGIINRLAAK